MANSMAVSAAHQGLALIATAKTVKQNGLKGGIVR